MLKVCNCDFRYSYKYIWLNDQYGKMQCAEVKYSQTYVVEQILSKNKHPCMYKTGHLHSIPPLYAKKIKDKRIVYSYDCIPSEIILG